MLIPDDAILGWCPSLGDDDEDVSLPQDTLFMTIKPFYSSSSAILSPVCPPLDTVRPKPCSSQSNSTPLATSSRNPVAHTQTTPVASSSDRRAHRNRSRDPSWIPRPRNAFIIFRCEYSREHSQSSQDPLNDDDDDDPTNDVHAPAKTLSKRAAEAWKQLSPSERDRYKVLADKEREEHARLYPHYRFRPMKRQASGTSKSLSDGAKAAKAASPERERRRAPSIHLPSVLSSPPETSRSSTSRERAEASIAVPQVTECTLPFPPLLPSDPLADASLLQQQPDYNDPLLFYSSPGVDASPVSPLLPVELYSSLGNTTTTAGSMPSDAFECGDSTFGPGPTNEELERAQALEAYSLGLYNYDLFPPFTFPEC